MRPMTKKGNTVTSRVKEKRKALRAKVENLKRGWPCEDCREVFDPICMDFDHRPGETKIGSVSSMIWAGEDRVMLEIAKCDLVCSNCHRIRTRDRNA